MFYFFNIKYKYKALFTEQKIHRRFLYREKSTAIKKVLKHSRLSSKYSTKKDAEKFDILLFITFYSTTIETIFLALLCPNFTTPSQSA